MSRACLYAPQETGPPEFGVSSVSLAAGSNTEQDVTTSAPPIRPRQWYRPRVIARSLALRPKVYLAALAASAAALLLPGWLSLTTRAALAGDVGALVYLALSTRLMVRGSSESIRKQAAHQDDGAIVILALILVAIALGFCTIFGVLAEARRLAGGPRRC